MKKISLIHGTKAGTAVDFILDLATVFALVITRTARRAVPEKLMDWVKETTAKYVNPDGTANMPERYASTGLAYAKGKIEDYLSEGDLKVLENAGNQNDWKNDEVAGKWNHINLSGIQENFDPISAGYGNAFLYSAPVSGTCIFTGKPVTGQVRIEVSKADFENIDSSVERVAKVKELYTDEASTKALGKSVSKVTFGYFLAPGVPVTLLDPQNQPLEDVFGVTTRPTFKHNRGFRTRHEVKNGIGQDSFEDMDAKIEAAEAATTGIEELAKLKRQRMAKVAQRKIALTMESHEAEMAKIDTMTDEQLKSAHSDEYIAIQQRIDASINEAATFEA